MKAEQLEQFLPLLTETACLFQPPSNDAELEDAGRLLGRLSSLIEHQGRTDLIPYFHTVSRNIKDYEKAHNLSFYVEPLTPRELILAIMKEKELKRKDLTLEFGSAGSVSDFLNGKRDLTVKQAYALAARFHLRLESLLKPTGGFL